MGRSAISIHLLFRDSVITQPASTELLHIVVCLEVGSHYISPAGLELTRDVPASASQVVALKATMPSSLRILIQEGLLSVWLVVDQARPASS